MSPDLDTHADDIDERDGADYAGTCACCQTVYGDDEPGLYEMKWPDERLLCEGCCRAEAEAEYNLTGPDTP